MGYYNKYNYIDRDAFKPLADFDEIAKWVVQQKYGSHRFLCAMVRAMFSEKGPSELAEGLNDLVDKYVT